MADGKITRQEIFSSDVFTAFDELTVKANLLLTSFTKLAQEGKELNTAISSSKGFKEYSNSVTKAKENINQLSVQEQEYAKIVKQLEAEKAKLNLVQSEEYKQLQKIRQEKKNVIQLSDAEEGSINQLRAANKKLAQERNNVSTATERGRKRIQALNKQIDANNAKIKKNSDALTKQKINIGNYSSALGGLNSRFGMFIGVAQQAAKSIALIFTSPILLAITAMVGAIAALGKAFTKTDSGATAFAATIEQLKTILDVFLQQINRLRRGEELTMEQFKEATQAAKDYTYAMDDLNDAKIQSISTDKRQKSQIEELLAQSKDQRKSDKERIALMSEAMKIQEDYYGRQVRYAEQEYQLELEYASKRFNVNKTTLEKYVAMDEEAAKMMLEVHTGLARARDELGDDWAEKLEKLYAARFEAIEEEAKRSKEITSLLTGLQKRQVSGMAEVTEVKKKQVQDLNQADLQELENFGNYIHDKQAVREEDAERYDQWLEKENEARLMYHENKLAIDQLAAENEYQARLISLEEQRKNEIEAAKKVGADVAQIRKKYSLIEQRIEEEKARANAETMSEYLSNIAGLFSENTIAYKAIAVAEATINTYLAATQALADLKTMDPISKIVGMVAVIGSGLATVAKIVSTNVPKYATGTNYSPEGWAVTGEKGSELMIDRKGRVGFSPEKASMTYLEKGTKIIPADITRRIMSDTITANILMSRGKRSEGKELIEALSEDNRKLRNVIQNKGNASININSAGITVMTESGRTLQRKIDKYFRT
jgi:hypothetical protein